MLLSRKTGIYAQLGNTPKQQVRLGRKHSLGTSSYCYYMAPEAGSHEPRDSFTLPLSAETGPK